MAYQTTTLADLLVLLARRYEQQPFWSDADATKALNEGLRIYNLITGIYRDATTQPLIPDDNHLYVGGTLIKGARVLVNNRPLVLTSIDALDKMAPNWPVVNTGSGGLVPTAPIFWAPIGLTEIVVYPKEAPPGQSPCTVNGVRNTTLLSAPGDFLNLGEEEINSLTGYALHVLSFAKGIEALQNTRPLLVEFFKTAAKKNSVFAASSLYRKIIGWDRTRSSDPMRDQESLQAGNQLAASEASQGDQ